MEIIKYCSFPVLLFQKKTSVFEINSFHERLTLKKSYLLGHSYEQNMRKVIYVSWFLKASVLLEIELIFLLQSIKLAVSFLYKEFEMAQVY